MNLFLYTENPPPGRDTLFPLLPLIVLIPIIAAISLFAFNERRSFGIALASSVVMFLLVAYAAYLGLSSGFGALSFSQGYIPSLRVYLSLQVTQYSVIFLVMSAIVLLSASIVARGFIKESGRIYNFLFLIVYISALGLFLSGSLFLFYVFWTLGDAAMFFIIYLSGGFDRKCRHKVHSILHGSESLPASGADGDIRQRPDAHLRPRLHRQPAASIPASAQFIAMLFLSFAFLIKIPVFPFHGWLPDAYTEAPTQAAWFSPG